MPAAAGTTTDHVPLPASRLSAGASTSSLMSMSRLHTTPSTDSLMSEASTTGGLEVGKFDLSAMKSELTQSSGVGGILPSCVPDSALSETDQPASDMVKFTIGHGMEFVTPHSSCGGTVDVKPLLPDVDTSVGLVAGRTDGPGVKTEDWKDEKERVMMKMMMKDEAVSSEPATSSSSAAAAGGGGGGGVSQGDSSELKPDADKPASTVDAVATSNVTSSSSSAAATAGGSEIMAVASASDLKKESQAINYDWVSCQLHSLSFSYRVAQLLFTLVIRVAQKCSSSLVIIRSLN